MAKIIVNINKEEQKEMKEIEKFIEGLTKEEKIKLKGFLEGMKFSSNQEQGISQNKKGDEKK